VTIAPDAALDDPALVAHDAGLRYVHDTGPGHRRVRCGAGFRFVDPDGHPVPPGPERDRVRALVIPPAWTDVWISVHPNGHLQATGRDARGRKQYRYHDRWREVRDAGKFHRLHAFGQTLGDLRADIDAELGRRGPLDRDKVLALVVRLLDETLIRVGSAEYAATNDSYGLTTLGPEHVEVAGSEVRFCFVGKGGVEHEVAVSDRRLARLVEQCHELGGQELFAWTDGSGRVHDVGSADVNAWLQERTGEQVSAKVFRTWGATVVATETLAELGQPSSEREAEAQILEAIDAAAAQLGNTRAVCRSSYVHPRVPLAHAEGALLEHWAGSRRTRTHRRAERAVLSLLGDAATDG
jgi:DNA topoisomerase-1